MAETPDRRRRTDLDLFVLALIEAGLPTPYQMQGAAGLSQGATTPALERLLNGKFVRQSAPGVRGRVEYKATAKGRKHLSVRWLPLLESGPSGDIDSDLRVALLALWIGGSRSMASAFLRQAAARKQGPIGAVQPVPGEEGAPLLALSYRDLKSRFTRTLLSAEADILLQIAESLPTKRDRPSLRASLMTSKAR
jgi:DNA-binding PadR family transcriptional regulator